MTQDITERRPAEDALRRAEENFRSSVENSPLGIRIVTAEGKTLYANHAILDIYGYASIEELETTPRKEHYTPESYAEHQQRVEKRRCGEYVPSNYEMSIVHKNGEIRRLAVFRKEVLWYGEKQFQMIYHDITERKRAEEALRESKSRYLELVNLLPQTVSEMDEKGNLTFGNLTGTLVFGYTLEDVAKGLNILQLFIPEDRKRLSENIQRVLRGEQLGGIEYTALKKDGSNFPVLTYSSPIIRRGKAVGLRGITIDITERKRTQEALKDSEARYRALIDLGAQVGEAIIMLQDEEQKEGVHVSCNDTWLLITGYSNEELRNMSFFELVRPQDREVSLARHRAKMSGESIPGLFEITIMRKDGTEVPIEVTSAYSTYRGKRANVAYIRDITERKKMHEQLMTQDRLSSLGELVSGVAHELNNPLTSVIGFSELLLKRDLPYDVKEDLETISKEARRTANIVKNLLAFARRQPQEKKPIDINENIQRVLELRAHEQKVNNIQVITRFASDLPQIMGNAFQLQQVFLNIIINAEFFMIEAHNKGTLTITTKRIWDFVRASFADDGPGIPKENMRHLFSPFFTTKEVGKGTGLGLSICHGIIIEHGGRLYAESEPGKGSTFIMELPIRQEATGQGAAR